MLIATQNIYLFSFLEKQTTFKYFRGSLAAHVSRELAKYAFDMSLLGVVSSWSEIGQLALVWPCGTSVWAVMVSSYPGIGQPLNYEHLKSE